MRIDESQPGTRSGASFGEALKRERQARSITLRGMSEATKISIRSLEALEKNEFEALPGGAFTKGFVRSYAICVGLDPEEMINAYLLELAKKRKEPEPEVLPSAEERRRDLLRIGLLVGAGLALLTLVALGAWLLGRFWS